MSFDLATRFFERFLGPLNDIQSVPVSGWRLVEILWPLNDLFRQYLSRIKIIRYESRFEPEADKAIERFSEKPDPAAWGDISPGAWRVLLERHMQITVVALANEKEGSPITVLPSGLPKDAELPGVMLLMLHQMKLPWPPEDRAGLELPEGPPPVSMKLH